MELLTYKTILWWLVHFKIHIPLKTEPDSGLDFKLNKVSQSDQDSGLIYYMWEIMFSSLLSLNSSAFFSQYVYCPTD